MCNIEERESCAHGNEAYKFVFQMKMIISMYIINPFELRWLGSSSFFLKSGLDHLL